MMVAFHACKVDPVILTLETVASIIAGAVANSGQHGVLRGLTTMQIQCCLLYGNRFPTIGIQALGSHPHGHYTFVIEFYVVLSLICTHVLTNPY